MKIELRRGTKERNCTFSDGPRGFALAAFGSRQRVRGVRKRRSRYVRLLGQGLRRERGPTPGDSPRSSKRGSRRHRSRYCRAWVTGFEACLRTGFVGERHHDYPRATFYGTATLGLYNVTTAARFCSCALLLHRTHACHPSSSGRSGEALATTLYTFGFDVGLVLVQRQERTMSSCEALWRNSAHLRNTS